MGHPVGVRWALGVVPVLLYTLTVFALGLSPAGPLVPRTIRHIDKLVHFLAFGALVPLVARALPALVPTLGWRRGVVLSAAVASGLGALLEVCQSFMPPRSADVLDWAFDTAGAVVFAALAARLRKLVTWYGVASR